MTGRSPYHEKRTASLIKHEAARFIAREALADPLITVVGVKLRSHDERADVFVSVFPIGKIPIALAFLARQREAFSEYLKGHARLSPLPRITFLLDDGSLATLPDEAAE